MNLRMNLRICQFRWFTGEIPPLCLPAPFQVGFITDQVVRIRLESRLCKMNEPGRRGWGGGRGGRGGRGERDEMNETDAPGAFSPPLRCPFFYVTPSMKKNKTSNIETRKYENKKEERNSYKNQQELDQVITVMSQ